MTCDALFNTQCFVGGFLPIVLVGYWLVPSRRWKLAWITLASFVFYSLWDVRFVGLLLAAALVDFFIALRLSRSATHRKAWLTSSIVFNLGVLAFFKYAVFFAANARSLFDFLGVPVEIPGFSIVLPVGISFYTFQTMSYTIDVYRDRLPATRDFTKYLAFVSLFPQLVAGPIVRYSHLSQQLDDIPRRLPWPLIGHGVALFAIGLGKKILIADPIARLVDPLWASSASLTTADAWLAALGYTLQLYFDFSGYSDMAIGLGALLGLRFPINFRAPYKALNPSDFWRRWHISLSTFLRDYLYIPLGGNRRGPTRQRANLAIVMLLGGLWHGAAWTFVVWGAYHGMLLVLYQTTSRFWDAAPIVLQRALTLSLVVVGWVFFRAPDLTTAFGMLNTMLVPSSLALGSAGLPLLAAVVGGLVVVNLAKSTATLRLRPSRALHIAVATALLLMFLLLREESPFLYYQF